MLESATNYVGPKDQTYCFAAIWASDLRYRRETTSKLIVRLALGSWGEIGLPALSTSSARSMAVSQPSARRAVPVPVKAEGASRVRRMPAAGETGDRHEIVKEEHEQFEECAGGGAEDVDRYIKRTDKEFTR